MTPPPSNNIHKNIKTLYINMSNTQNEKIKTNKKPLKDKKQKIKKPEHTPSQDIFLSNFIKQIKEDCEIRYIIYEII